jgi:hypothetical protein
VKGQKDGRTRNWNFILYPESAPKDWRGIINETRIEWVESPLHDKDINPKWSADEETGEEQYKKAHHHITILFPSHKSYDQVKQLTDSLNAPIPIPCQSVKGSIRYMVHKDNPEKHQYDWNDIRCHGGADLDSLCMATQTERMKIQDEIEEYIICNNVTELVDLVIYARREGLSEWLNIVRNHSTLYFTNLLRCQRYKNKRQRECDDD